MTPDNCPLLDAFGLGMVLMDIIWGVFEAGRSNGRKEK